jgi:outer membrane protein assembly factor BamD
MTTRAFILAIILVTTLEFGCHSSNVVENLSAEDRYQLAKAKFDDGNYLDAIEDFRVITLQYPGGRVADSAQFFLAQSYFHRDQFILAASEYETLVRSMSASPMVPEARFQVGMCYFELSPSSDLDQQYTYKALDAFQTFIEYHPTNALVPQAEEKIRELNTKLAEKEYNSGKIYMKMEYYGAAERQFQFVLEKYHDTDYAPPALIGEVEALIARKKYSEAKKEIDKFFVRYPSSSLIDRAKQLSEQIESNRESTGNSKTDDKGHSETQNSQSEVR